MRRLWALCLLALACTGAWARPDIFAGREWEPDVRVVRGTRLSVADSSGGPMEQQVFTCLISQGDLQVRRCDRSATTTVGDSLAPCYKAEYEITLEIFSGKGRHRKNRASRHHHEALALESGRASSLDAWRWTHFDVELPPGRYTWWVEFKDLLSRRLVRREGEFTVLDLGKSDMALGRLWLLAEADSLAPDPLASPPFLEQRGGAHPPELVVYYEVWSRHAAELQLESRIVDRRDRERHRRTVDRSYPAGVTRNLLRVPLHELGSGEYRVELALHGKEGARRSRKGPASSRRLPWREDAWWDEDALATWQAGLFSVRWQGEPVSPSDLDRAVEQVRYLLPPRAFKEMQEAPMSRKKILFDDFWASVDPSPGDEVNELLGEYYRRAEFADRRFSWSRFAGWRSDRGRIYMLYGDPDQVERQDGDLDQPSWERWSYHESGRDFLFVDRQGFGDFQLVLNP